jgi:hypothetical protein
MKRAFLRLGVVPLLALLLIGAVQVWQAEPSKKGNYISNGVVVGGEAQGDVSIRNMRGRQVKEENGVPGYTRIVFDFSTGGRKLKRATFFHVSVGSTPGVVQVTVDGVVSFDKNAASVAKKLVSGVVDSCEIRHFKEEKKLVARFKGSKDITAEVFEIRNPGRLVLDLR